MVVKRKPGRPSKKEQDQAEILLKLRNLVDKQDDLISQANDQISDLRTNVEFYRKQVNHLIALLNILTKGS
jgi:predicted ribosome quality control (RQC) complex YloA/Tae2 family protein